MIRMFGSTYRCEQCFSILKFIKNKFLTSLTDEHMLHCLRTATYNVSLTTVYTIANSTNYHIDSIYII